ncbi:hypothetical protein [Sulfuriroseicoccus oceanibius]|uniref:Uncharacterized protein n=1 Tax=Sulfuriroseicoccus oceanibius TaxID=2707525 RepID=A0A6B3L1Z4_9BACT|nr:hypothetical protein [Sulfuriroseicoccus oceanibius]QQL43727.1 hypothetical protein G3M56_007385 [Sulfuriroseicoccus oceanibius]
METTTLTIPEAEKFTAAQIIKTDSAGRIRVSRERREELLDLFEQSAMSGAEFARFVSVRATALEAGRALAGICLLITPTDALAVARSEPSPTPTASALRSHHP